MNIPILSNKPRVPKELLEALGKLDIVSTLILMGFLLDHALKLLGLSSKQPIPAQPIKGIHENT